MKISKKPCKSKNLAKAKKPRNGKKPCKERQKPCKNFG
jgi:hypothetical protein